MPVAILTGASRGLGHALARQLSADGWSLVVDGRDGAALNAARRTWCPAAAVRAVPGDVTDPRHRDALVAAARDLGGLDALVHNASTLGVSPLPPLAEYPVEELETVYRTNVFAPLVLTQLALPLVRPGGVVLSVTSDAAREAYEGWGGYGSSKAALEQISAVLTVERADLRIYAVDPGDMRTRMHAEAAPDEDLSSLPPPEVSVPGLVRLLAGDLPSGRYVARDLIRKQAA